MTNGHLIKSFVVYHKNDHWSTIFLFFLSFFSFCMWRVHTPSFRTFVLHALSPDKKGRGLNWHPSLNCYIIFPPYRPAPLFRSQVCNHQVCKPLFTFSFLKPYLPIYAWHFPHVPLLADQFLPIGMEFLGFPI